MVSSTSALVLQACEKRLHDSCPSNPGNHTNNANHANDSNKANDANHTNSSSTTADHAHYADDANNSYNTNYNQDVFKMRAYQGNAVALLFRSGKAGLRDGQHEESAKEKDRDFCLQRLRRDQ